MNTEFNEVLNEIKKIIKKNSERDIILYQISKFLKMNIFHYDWVGFYIMDEEKEGLFLGPFDGLPTEHTFISVGKGICGQVALCKTSIVVQDVSTIGNYLSCSKDVQSEIVVPILKNGIFVAEIDIDSHLNSPFTDEDKILLENICKELENIF